MLLLKFRCGSPASTLLLLSCCISSALVSLSLIGSCHVAPRILNSYRGLGPFLMQLILHKYGL